MRTGDYHVALGAEGFALFEKCKRVLSGCKSSRQLRVAQAYVKLAMKRICPETIDLSGYGTHSNPEIEKYLRLLDNKMRNKKLPYY